jgi:23S rRNA (cytosine1962-C5)-methyltransferase
MPEYPVMHLKTSREKSVLRRHPWIFAGSVGWMEGEPASGETVLVQDARGQSLALAAFSPESQIRGRAWTWDVNQTIDEAFFRRRLESAIHMRRSLGLERPGAAVRLVHGESDGLPGLVVDRYADFLVLQVLSAGIERWRERLGRILLELSGAQGIYERSDVDVRRLEGLLERSGSLLGNTPPGRVEIVEDGLHYAVDVRGGHKTGFYLDQRSNRHQVRKLAHDKDVLDCFCYTGGFTLNALVGGAKSVLAVDSSAEALAQAQEQVELNGLDDGRARWQEGDVFRVLRLLRDQSQQFDMIVLDPPKFAPTSVQVERAARGYKDINLLAFKLLRPGGLLVTFSCSGGVTAELFQKIVAGAALDAGLDGRIVRHLHASGDHPVGIHFPEGEYLKGLVVEVAP